MSTDDIEELQSSELGTKEYWDKSYALEISNYSNNGRVGEIWMEESQHRVIKWMQNNNIKTRDSIVDLGCGNGMILIELAQEGFNNLTGIDYSSHAIELAKNVAKDQDVNITYKEFDLLMNNDDKLQELGQFFVVHDKGKKKTNFFNFFQNMLQNFVAGTYDAISLHPDNSKEKRTAYIDNLYKLLENDGFMIMTSCNWTQSELENSFKNKFVKHSVIPTPSFQFGGQIGNVFTSLVFKKVL